MTRGEMIATGMFVLVFVAGAAHATPPDPPPNILLIMADDYPWGYYSQMQQVDGDVCTTADGTSCTSGLGCFCTPTQRADFPLPDDENTPADDSFKTPGLDALAQRGAFFPIGHSGASFCHPSFQATLTGLYEKDFLKGRKERPEPGATYPVQPHINVPPTPANPYYIVEYLNEALFDSRKHLPTPTPNGTPQPSNLKYRSLGVGKIWTRGGFRNAGFDYGWNGAGRASIEPIIQFVLDEREGGKEHIAHSTFCKNRYAVCPPESERTIERSINLQLPWFVWFAPNLPHYPKDVKDRVMRTLTHASKCKDNNGEYTDACVEPPRTDPACNELTNPDFVGPPACSLVPLLAAMEELAEKYTNHPEHNYHIPYLQNIMLLDYWVDHLQQFLLDPAPPVGIPGPYAALDQHTIVAYQADNGYVYPKSKRGISENAFRNPIMISWPGQIAPDMYPQMVNALDLLPTLVDYATGETFEECPSDAPATNKTKPGAQIVFPPATTTDCDELMSQAPQSERHLTCGCLPGRSMRPVLSGALGAARRMMMGQNSTDNVYVRSASGMRLVRKANCKYKLYDIKSDLDERDDCFTTPDTTCLDYQDSNWAAGDCAAYNCPGASCTETCAGVGSESCAEVKEWQCELQHWYPPPKIINDCDFALN